MLPDYCLKKMTNATHTGRMSFIITVTRNLFACRTSAALLAALLQYPAFFCCTPVPAPAKRIAAGEYIDVFFFDTLSPQYLDSYQRLKADDVLYAMSSVGPKRVVALSVGSKDAMTWADIRTYADLCKYSFSLKEDSPGKPLMASEGILGDGISRVVDLQMRTSLARVVLGSVACDFSDTPYTGQGFDNRLIYMQYAGVEARPFGPGHEIPLSTINQGWLDSAAVMSFPRPDMLLQSGLGTIWRQRIKEEREFWCYGNDVDSSALGRPVTRIVLDGYVGEHHCYYPIELPRLKAGHTMRLDVTILRMGTPDPDFPAGGDMIKLETRTAPWIIRDEREETF